jgi:type I restriction enzyme S subunit
LPEGWRKGTLAEIVENYDSKRIPMSSMERAKRKGSFPYFGAASIMDYVDDYLFDGDFILLGEDGTVQDDKGYPVLQRAIGKFWVNNHAHVLNSKSPIDNNYLEILLRNTKVNHIVTGAVQPKINQGNLNNLQIVLPHIQTIISFQSSIHGLLALRQNNRDEIISLIATRDYLLPKLISGEVIPSDLKQIEQVL